MGTEAVWVPWVLAAAGAATGAYADRQEAKATDRTLAQQIDNSAAKNQEANARVSELAGDIKKGGTEGDRNAAMAQYVQQLRATSGSATRGLGQQGGSSDRFNQEATQAALGVSDYGLNRAGTASTIDSILQQRDNETQLRGRAGVDVQNISRQARMQDFLDGLKVRAAGNSQGNTRALAGLFNGASSATGGMGGGGGSAATMYDPDAYAKYAQNAGFNFNF